MKLSALVADLKVSLLHPQRDPDILAATMDSRAVPAGSLFVALPGTRYNGAEFAAEAVAKGAVAVLSKEALDLDGAVPQVLAEHPGQILGAMASRLVGDPSRSMDLVGVTGTNGKTTTCTLLEAMAKEAGRRVGVIGTTGIRSASGSVEATHTTPDALGLQSVLRRFVDEGCDTTLLEVSSHALVQGRIAGCHFAAVGFTQLGRDHLDYHGTVEAYEEAKAGLFTGAVGIEAPAKVAIVIDNASGQRLAQDARERGQEVLAVGQGEDADLRWAVVKEDEKGTLLRFSGSLGEQECTLSLVGRHNVSNAALACALGHLLGWPREALFQGMISVRSPRGRLERVDLGPGAPTVYVDYAHTPDALETTLESLKKLGGSRLTVVFGCGGERDVGKRPEMGEVAGRLADVVILTNDNPRSESPSSIVRAIASGTTAATQIELDRGEAIRQALRGAQPDEIVLIAGKGHETQQDLGDRLIEFSDAEEARIAWEEFR